MAPDDRVITALQCNTLHQHVACCDNAFICTFLLINLSGFILIGAFSILTPYQDPGQQIVRLEFR